MLVAKSVSNTRETPLRNCTNTTLLILPIVRNLSQGLKNLKEPWNQQSHAPDKEQMITTDNIVRGSILEVVVRRTGSQLQWPKKYPGAVSLRVKANIDKTQKHLLVNKRSKWETP